MVKLFFNDLYQGTEEDVDEKNSMSKQSKRLSLNLPRLLTTEMMSQQFGFLGFGLDE